MKNILIITDNNIHKRKLLSSIELAVAVAAAASWSAEELDTFHGPLFRFHAAPSKVSRNAH
jgi:hypothetical protein